MPKKQSNKKDSEEAQGSHPLAINPRELIQQARDSSHRAHEEQLVRRILAKLHKDDNGLRFKLRREHKNSTGDDRLSLRTYCRVTDCPVTIAHGELPEKVNKGLLLQQLVRLHEKAPVVQTFVRTASELYADERDKPLCVVFNWSYMPGGLCVHTLATSQISFGIRITCKFSDAAVTIEPFDQFLDLLAQRL